MSLIELIFNQISLLARFARLNIKNPQANAFSPYDLLSSKENIRASHVINEIWSIISLKMKIYESFLQTFHFCISNELLFCVFVCLLVLGIILWYWQISSKFRWFLDALLYLIFPKKICWKLYIWCFQRLSLLKRKPLDF